MQPFQNKAQHYFYWQAPLNDDTSQVLSCLHCSICMHETGDKEEGVVGKGYKQNSVLKLRGKKRAQIRDVIFKKCLCFLESYYLEKHHPAVLTMKWIKPYNWCGAKKITFFQHTTTKKPQTTCFNQNIPFKVCLCSEKNPKQTWNISTENQDTSNLETLQQLNFKSLVVCRPGFLATWDLPWCTSVSFLVGHSHGTEDAGHLGK